MLALTSFVQTPIRRIFDEAGPLFIHACRSGPDRPAGQSSCCAPRTRCGPARVSPRAGSEPILGHRADARHSRRSPPGGPWARARPPVQDMQPGGLASGPDVRAYATPTRAYECHQHRFMLEVMRAYQTGAPSVCCVSARSSRPPTLCRTLIPRASRQSLTGSRYPPLAISHSTGTCLASIPPESCASRIACFARSTVQASAGLQGFHGKPIAVPRRPVDRPDPERLQSRFEAFLDSAA